MLLVEEAKKKKKEQERKQIVGDDIPEWQSVSDKKTFILNMKETISFGVGDGVKFNNENTG